MPRNSRALLSVEIRTAANRGPPRPLLSWAFRRSETVSAGPKRNRLPGSCPFVPSEAELDEPEPLRTLRCFRTRVRTGFRRT